MGVVEGRPENLATRNILEGGGNPAAHLHRAGIDRFGRAEARQCGAKGPDQKDRLDHVAACLLDRERRKLAVIQRALRHDAIDAKAKLLGYLGEREFRDVAIAAALMRQQTMGVFDGTFASLDGDIHASVSLRNKPRGAGYRDNGIVGHQYDIDAARKQRGIDGKSFEQVRWLDRGLQNSGAVDAGAAQFEGGTLRQALDLQDQRRRTIRILVGAEREAVESREGSRLANERKAADRRIRDHRRADMELEPFGDV